MSEYLLINGLFNNENCPIFYLKLPNSKLVKLGEKKSDSYLCLNIHSWKFFFGLLIKRDILVFAESYLKGFISYEGDLIELLKLKNYIDFKDLSFFKLCKLIFRFLVEK